MSNDSSKDSTSAGGPYADVAPALDEITRKVLFGDVWESPVCRSATGA